jgi:hypothetical protein
MDEDDAEEGDDDDDNEEEEEEGGEEKRVRKMTGEVEGEEEATPCVAPWPSFAGHGRPQAPPLQRGRRHDRAL